MEELKTTIKSWYDKQSYYIQNRIEHFEIGISQQTEVSFGWENDVNTEYCDQHNIPYYNMNRDGGTIVHFEGNIALVWIYNNQKYHKFMLSTMLQDIANFLKEKGLNVELNHNDILIDGYKVCSGHSYNLSPDFKWSYEAIQVSMNCDINLINNICKKQMTKVPKGLSDFGITTNEILTFIYNWLDDNQIKGE